MYLQIIDKIKKNKQTKKATNLSKMIYYGIFFILHI